MSNYTKTTNFTAKDTLPTGNTAKIIKGAEFDTEFDAIQTAVASKSDSNSPTFTGTVTAATLTVSGTLTAGEVTAPTVTVSGTLTAGTIEGGVY